MKSRLISANIEKSGRFRLSSATIAFFIAFCIIVIYIGNVVTISSLSNLSKDFHPNEMDFLKRTINNSETRNDIQTNTSPNSENVENKVMELQKPPEKHIIMTTPKMIAVEPTIQKKLSQEERIMNEMREEIASEMEDFVYPPLTELTPETNGNPIRSVILSTWRSGSSFFGDILNAMPATYYHFEPLMYFGDIEIRNESKLINEAMETLHQLQRCNYTGQNKYLGHVMLNYNTRLWKYCSNFPEHDLCHNQSFLSSFCGLFPFQVLKMVRLRAESSEPLLMDSNLNVVLLIRDPRGVVSSRNREQWCYAGPECGNYTNICLDMVSDYKAARYLMKKYPQRFKVLRYEDLSLNPFEVTDDILNFYGLPFHDDVKDFLITHTNKKLGDSMSTFRDSKNTAFSWMQNMTFAEIDKIQSECTEAMDLWGYQKLMSEDDLKNNTFSPLMSLPFDKENVVDDKIQNDEMI